MIVFAAAHGGYPGEVLPYDEYLRCRECGTSYPLDALGVLEDCPMCDGEIDVLRANPAPEPTIRMPL